MAQATRAQLLAAAVTAAGTAAFASGSGTLFPTYSLWVELNGTWFTGLTTAKVYSQTFISTVPLSGYASAAALITALQAAVIDPEPSTGTGPTP